MDRASSCIIDGRKNGRRERRQETTEAIKTCGLCSHMRVLNKGKTAECEMKSKGMHPNIKFQRKPGSDFDTFAWLKARDCPHYDGDEDDPAEEEIAEY